MKLSTSLLLLATASTCVSARWTDFLTGLLGSGVKQAPLESSSESEGHVEDLESLVARRVWNVTSENWLSLPDAGDGEVPVEWFYYFTSSNVNGTSNVTFWDGVFKETVYALSKDKNGVKFGKADCAADASKDLCKDFYITSQFKIPQFYHLVSYPDTKSVEIRELPWNYTTDEIEDQVNHYAKFYTNEEWKNVEPWTGVFNPIDGALKGVRPYAAVALTYYEAMPQWLTMLLISLTGRTIMTRISKRTTDPARVPSPAVPSAPQAAS